MPYLSKLTKRLALASAGVLFALVSGCTTTDVVTEPSVTDVAEVLVSPDSVAGRVGARFRLSATVRDNRGQAMLAERLDWTSADPTIATVDTLGTVMLVGSGTTEVRATTKGRSGRTKVTSIATDTTTAPVDTTTAPAPAPVDTAPTPAPVDTTPAPAPQDTVPSTSAGYTREPAGFTPLTDWNWPSHEGEGWRYEGANSTTGAFQSVVTSGYGSAPPAGGPTVLQATYIAGTAGGFGSGRTYHSIPAGVNEVFIGFWHKFSADYQASTNSNKMWFMMFGNERAFLGFRDRPEDSPRRSYKMTLSSFGPTPNTALPSTPGVLIPLGQWYKLEWYFKRNTTGQSNGIIRVWMNGVLIHEYTNLVFPGAMTTFYYEGTHNGNDGIIPANMNWWVSRAYISAPTP